MTSSTTSRAKIEKSEAEWRRLLTPEQYYVTRQHGTERAFSGPYWNEKHAGTYACVCCGTPLFSSETKFDSGTGWPSFWAPLARDAVDEHEDRSWFARRTEVRCASRSEEHTSELQSRQYLVCRLLLEKKKRTTSPSAVTRML